MPILVRSIPSGYRIKRWGHIGNSEQWWRSSGQAYLERRILRRYNPNMPSDTWLVYTNGKEFTLLEKF